MYGVGKHDTTIASSPCLVATAVASCSTQMCYCCIGMYSSTRPSCQQFRRTSGLGRKSIQCTTTTAAVLYNTTMIYVCIYIYILVRQHHCLLYYCIRVDRVHQPPCDTFPTSTCCAVCCGDTPRRGKLAYLEEEWRPRL